MSSRADVPSPIFSRIGRWRSWTSTATCMRRGCYGRQCTAAPGRERKPVDVVRARVGVLPASAHGADVRDSIKAYSVPQPGGRSRPLRYLSCDPGRKRNMRLRDTVRRWALPAGWRLPCGPRTTDAGRNVAVFRAYAERFAGNPRPVGCRSRGVCLEHGDRDRSSTWAAQRHERMPRQRDPWDPVEVRSSGTTGRQWRARGWHTPAKPAAIWSDVGSKR